MSPDDYLRQRLEHHLPDEQGKEELIALLLPLLSMGARQSASTWKGLREEVAQAVVLALKDDAERHWLISWEGSLERANQIVAVSEARGDLAIQALGTMAKADALKLVTGRLEEAWELLDYAGRLYRMSHLPETEREIGWARTRIGRVYICAEVGKIEQGFAEAEQAREILEREKVWQRVIALHIAWGNALSTLYRFLEARDQFVMALAVTQHAQESANLYLPAIYNNMASTEWHIGNKRIALQYYLAVANELEQRQEVSGWALTQHNIAALYVAQGKYRLALRTLQVAEPILKERLPNVWFTAIQNIIECLIALNRPSDAYSWCESLTQEFLAGMAPIQRARYLLWLAETKRALGFKKEAISLLASAHQIYVVSGMTLAAAQVMLRDMELAADDGRVDELKERFSDLILIWKEQQSPEGLARTYTLLSRCLLRENRFEDAIANSRAAIDAARRMSLGLPRYTAHLILAQAMEATDKPHHARRHYKASLSTLTRVRNNTSYSYRAAFVQTRLEAFHGLISLELKEGDLENALSVLEGFKGSTFRDYLANNEHFKWARIPENEVLRSKLEGLKQTLVQLERQADVDEREVPYQQRQKLERGIRSITETLYLYTDNIPIAPNGQVVIHEIQAVLPPYGVLLEYYNDGKQVWRFRISSTDLSVERLDTQLEVLDSLIMQLHEHLRTVIRTHEPAGVESRVQTRKARVLTNKLGQILLSGLENDLSRFNRLYIVPYGLLHLLPFNMLRVNDAYLIEQVEIVTLPSATILLNQNQQRLSGNRWVGWSRGGKLPQAVSEVRRLQARWGGELYCEEDATRSVLEHGPTQILHISTHGVHRVDQDFDLSYITMADRDIYGDDVLQLSLCHDLVTLSACEAGLVKVAGGDEIVGLGRSFLFAGAAAIVTTLWQIREEVALSMMDRFYEGLFAGLTKPEALRRAQVELLEEHPHWHPAYWAAFQFVGNPNRLM